MSEAVVNGNNYPWLRGECTYVPSPRRPGSVPRGSTPTRGLTGCSGVLRSHNGMSEMPDSRAGKVQIYAR